MEFKDKKTEQRLFQFVSGREDCESGKMTAALQWGLFFKARLLLISTCLTLLVVLAAPSQLFGEDAKALDQQGVAAMKTHKYDAAIAAYTKIIEAEPKSAAPYFNRASAYERKGAHAKAIADLRQTIALDPNEMFAESKLAWILATCSQADLRNGKEAVKLATKACEFSQWKNRTTLNCLAAAYAEVGDFDQAVKWQTQALDLPTITATATENDKSRLALFQAHQPFYE